MIFLLIILIALYITRKPRLYKLLDPFLAYMMTSAGLTDGRLLRKNEKKIEYVFMAKSLEINSISIILIINNLNQLFKSIYVIFNLYQLLIL